MAQCMYKTPHPKVDPDRLSKVDCHTEVFEKQGSYLWTISHFETVHLQRAQKLKSSSFSILNDDFKWRLELECPSRGYGGLRDKSHVECNLFPDREMPHVTNFLPISGKLRISILNINCERAVSYHEKFLFEDDEETDHLGPFILISRENLMNKKAQIFPQDKLTVFLELSYVKRTDIVNICNNFDSVTQNILEARLSMDFNQLFNNKNFYDVNIFVKSKIYPAHKCVLVARSPVFKTMFERDMPNGKIAHINITDIDEEIFEETLRYIYSGKLCNLKKYAKELFVVADKYDLKELKILCEDELCKDLSADNNWLKVLVLGEEHHDNFMKSRALEFINLQIRSGSKIMTTETWNQLTTHHFSLLKEILSSFVEK